jgi:hypothetical protein
MQLESRELLTKLDVKGHWAFDKHTDACEGHELAEPSVVARQSQGGILTEELLWTNYISTRELQREETRDTNVCAAVTRKVLS